MAPRETMPIKESWLRPVEHLVLPALESRVRVIGFTAPEHGTGVTSLSRVAAEVLSRSGARVLLLDLSGNPAVVPAKKGWLPGAGNATACIERDPAGYDVLAAAFSPEGRFLFNNARSLRATLTEELKGHSAVIVDLPPLLDGRTDSINPLACALVCDEVVLVCAHEVSSRATATEAADAARRAGIKLTGVVWNQLGAPTIGQQMAEVVRRRLSFAPALANMLGLRLTRSGLLNG